MEKEVKTEQQITQMITAARDSVWVIGDTIQKLENGQTPSRELKGAIERNVGHLKIVVADEDVINSGQDISDLQAAIATGESKLAESIWPTE
jgi:hypothetical protein